MTRRLLVVSHPAILPTNQLPYAALAGRGWDVGLVTPSRWRHDYAAGSIRPAALPAFEGRMTPVPVALPGRPLRHAYLARLAAVLRHHRPDALFVEQEPCSVAALQWAVAAHRVGVPFGVQMDENLDRRLPWPAQAWRRWVLSQAAFVAARSPAAAGLARRWGARGQVRLVPHHVPGWPGASPASSDRFRVGYAGRLVAEKGLDTLVDAVRRLDGPVDLVVAGDGPERERLASAALGQARLRLMTGLAHDGMDQAYREMDVLVLPSRSTRVWREQFGRVLAEALSCGVPVIGSDSGAIPWVVTTTGGGRVFPEGDDAALAGLLRELRDDPEGRAGLAATGRQRVRELFSPEATASDLEALLEGAADARPRVALVAHGVHDGGGMETACAELVRHLHQDVRFVVVSADLAADLRPLVERWDRVPAPARPFPLRFVTFLTVAAVAVRRARVDLVHAVGAIIPNRVDVTMVQYCHAAAPARRHGRDPVRRVSGALSRALSLAAERWCYRPGRTRCLAAVSPGTAAELGENFPAVPTVVIPNGVDLARFSPDPSHRAAVRVAEGAGGAVVALFVGGDWERKGLAVAIDAVAKARAGGAPFVLWVVGDGDVGRYERRARERGVLSHVRFFGARRDTEAFYRAADLLVLPTAYETFSLVCFEAAACGLPLVVTSIPTAAALVGQGEAGVVVPPEPGAVADALVALSDPAVRGRMGSAARTRVAGYTWGAVASSTVALYRELLGTASEVGR